MNNHNSNFGRSTKKEDKNFRNFNNCLALREQCYLLNILAKLKSIFYVFCPRQNISLKYLQAPPILTQTPPSVKLQPQVQTLN